MPAPRGPSILPTSAHEVRKSKPSAGRLDLLCAWANGGETPPLRAFEAAAAGSDHHGQLGDAAGTCRKKATRNPQIDNDRILAIEYTHPHAAHFGVSVYQPPPLTTAPQLQKPQQPIDSISSLPH